MSFSKFSIVLRHQTNVLKFFHKKVSMSNLHKKPCLKNNVLHWNISLCRAKLKKSFSWYVCLHFKCYVKVQIVKWMMLKRRHVNIRTKDLKSLEQVLKKYSCLLLDCTLRFFLLTRKSHVSWERKMLYNLKCHFSCFIKNF